MAPATILPGLLRRLLHARLCQGDVDALLLGPFGIPLAAPEDRPFWPGYTPGGSLLSLASPPTPESNFAAKHQCALWASLGYPKVLIESVAGP